MRAWADVAELFDRPDDQAWAEDRDRVSHEVRDVDIEVRIAGMDKG